MLLVSALLCWMQKKVLDAVYRLPVIEQQVIDMRSELSATRLEVDTLKSRVQYWEENRAHTKQP